MKSARDAVAEIIASLQWGDKNAPEIAEITGSHVRTVWSWLAAFHRSGLIREVRRPGYVGHASIWSWQRIPFEFDDFEELPK